MRSFFYQDTGAIKIHENYIKGNFNIVTFTFNQTMSRLSQVVTDYRLERSIFSHDFSNQAIAGLSFSSLGPTLLSTSSW
jgi:hypothetical protein